MDITSINAVITSANTLFDIAKTIRNIAKQTDLREHIIKFQDEISVLQSRLLTAQQEQSQLIQIKNEIEKKLIEYENWENIKSQYELTEIAPQRYVYSMKKNNVTTEPMHWLCCKCFDIDHKKSILQHIDTIGSYRKYHCFNCQNNLLIKE